MANPMQTTRRTLSYVSMAVLVLLYLVPFYILVNLSLKDRLDLSSYWVPPSYFSLENFVQAIKNGHIIRALLNNLIIAAGCVSLSIILGASAAYPLSRHRTRLNRMVYIGIISLMIIPALIVSVPAYRLMGDIGLIDTRSGVILLNSIQVLPIVIFLYSGFISTIPRELEEAALLDGCGRVGTFIRIVFPLLKTITVTVVIFVGQGAWNEYANALLYLQSPRKYNMTINLSNFYNGYSVNLGWVAAGCLLNVLPLVLLFIFMQKYFIKGLTSGSLKG